MSKLQSTDMAASLLARLRERVPQQAADPLAMMSPKAAEMPEAAVLMAITTASEPELLLTVRTRDMPTHAGEVAFPGGRQHDGEDILQTALREAQEEVGIAMDEVELLGQLSPVASKHGLRVTPFVGLVAADIELQADPREIDEIFRVPLQFFLQKEPQLSAPFDFFGRQFRLPSYQYDGKTIWGLTAIMIIDLLNQVFDAGISIEE